jgi:brefeldin A-resistance guanine nucleotide exchange factor 1
MLYTKRFSFDTLNSSATEWNLVFSLWSGTATREEAASTTFGLISQLATRKVAGGLQADNFVGFIGVLNDFASAAGQGDVKYRNSPAG